MYLTPHCRSQLAVSRPKSLLPPLLGLTAFTILSTRFYIERSPLSYYLYLLFPVYFWTSIFSSPRAFLRLGSALSKTSRSTLIWGPLGILLILQAMVQGYMHREVFAAILLGMGFVWPILGMDGAFVRSQKTLVGGWATSCVLLAVFPMLPVEKGEHVGVM